MANVAELQLQLRRGTATAWTTADPTLLAGEWGYETDTNLLKIGDGATAWTSLGYWGTFQDVFMRAPETADPTSGVDTITSTIGFNSYDGNQFGLLGYQSNDSLDLINFAYDADVNIFATDGTSMASDCGITFNSQAFTINLDVNGSTETLFDYATSVASIDLATLTFFQGITLWDIATPHLQLGQNSVTFPKITRVGTQGGLTIAGGDDFNDGGYVALFGSTHPTAPGDVTWGSQNVEIARWDESAGQWNMYTGSGGSKTLTLTLANDETATFSGPVVTSESHRFGLTSTAAATLTLDETHYTVVGTLAGNQTFTLPTAVGIDGRIYNIKKTGASGTLTVDTTSSQTIDGSLTATLTVQYENLTVQSDGANWIIL